MFSDVNVCPVSTLRSGSICCQLSSHSLLSLSTPEGGCVHLVKESPTLFLSLHHMLLPLVSLGETIFLTCLHQWAKCPPAVKDNLIEFFRIQLLIHHPRYWLWVVEAYECNDLQIAGAPTLTMMGRGRLVMSLGDATWISCTTNCLQTLNQ